MPVNNIKILGNIGEVKAITDLTLKGYDVFTPVAGEHLRFDFIAHKDGEMFRIQAKYSSNGMISKRNSYATKKGNHATPYSDDDFDYYSIYLPDKDVVCYPNISFRGATLTTKLPNTTFPFYWYEDFLDFTDNAKKKTYKDFGYKLKHNKHIGSTDPRPNTRKVVRPSKEELSKLLWEKPTSLLAKDFGVSDVAITKWAKSYGIEKPPRGYWAKLNSSHQE